MVGSENVRESPFMDMNQIKLILKDIATGLRFLHQNKIIHRGMDVIMAFTSSPLADCLDLIQMLNHKTF